MGAPKEAKRLPKIFWWILLAVLLYILFSGEVMWRR
jgi:hypothetical protein